MPLSTTALLSYLFIVLGLARAQINVPNCTDSTFAWVGSLRALALYQDQLNLPLLTGDFYIQTLNSLQQSPCFVAGYLAAVCNNGS